VHEAIHTTQRMEMIGSRVNNYNTARSRRPTQKRPGLLAHTKTPTGRPTFACTLIRLTPLTVRGPRDRLSRLVGQPHPHAPQPLTSCSTVTPHSAALTWADWYNAKMKETYAEMARVITSSSPREACYTQAIQRSCSAADSNVLPPSPLDVTQQRSSPLVQPR
jgi:hypothetical protein